jgi:hypothetical protein
MPGNSSWIPYVPQGVTGLDDDDDEYNFYTDIFYVGECNKRRNDFCLCSAILDQKHVESFEMW